MMMAHINDGSIAGDNDSDFILYPIVDEGLYQHQFSQPQYATAAGDIVYASESTGPELGYTAMLSGEDSALEELQNSENIKQVTSTFYSLSEQAPGFCIDSYDFHSFNIPRTIGSYYTTTTAQDNTPLDDPRFLISTQAGAMGYQVGSHTEISDYTHSASNSASSSPFSGNEDPWSTTGVTSSTENIEAEPGFCSFVDPSELTNSPQQTLMEDLASSANSPHLSPTISRTPSCPSSPISPQRTTGRLSPLTSGRSYPTFPYPPPPRRDSIKSTTSSRGSKSPRLEPSEGIRMRSPSSPTGQQPLTGRDTVCPECGKSFRDMRAHLLTHQLERPEKCPIATCEYSKKGFARKYDCQRHTLTHYKGTMVCGFCPCAGSPAEKSFNRADVFKRHLMSVHNVEQTAPNGRKKSSSSLSHNGQVQRSPTSGKPLDHFEFQGTGKCSTCSGTFSNAQQFYEHLDDCVYSKVVQEEPGAAFNELNLSQVKLEDIAEYANSWKGRRSKSSLSEGEEKADDEDEEEGDHIELDEDLEDKSEKDETFTPGRSASKQLQKSYGSGRTPSTRSKTATQIKRGVRYRVSKTAPQDRNGKPRARRGGKRGKNFPPSWACAPGQPSTKRRMLMVYDGSTILCKDEMMMNTEWEVRASTGGENFISDLDFWTMQRAHAALDANINLEFP